MLSGIASLLTDAHNLFYLWTGTVSQWMINVQSLGLNRRSLVLELAEVFFLSLFVQHLIMSFFQVPVVLVFTKYDALELKCYSKLREEGKSHEVASIQVLELAHKTFQDEYLPRVLGAKFPPKTYVCLSGKILYSYRFFKFLTDVRTGQRRKSMFWIIWKNYGYSWQWCSCQLVCFNTEEQPRFVFSKKH